MIERTTTHFGDLVFDRDAIVRAALRAYVEGYFAQLPNCLSFPAADGALWTGDLQRGGIANYDGSGNNEVVAWTEVGVVGLAYELGFGPIEQLDLPASAVTGGPDDVRAAVPDLPEELEPALVLATGMLDVGPEHGEKLAGVGFWLFGDRVGGTLFLVDDPTLACGADRLAAWGLLKGGRLLPLDCGGYPRPGEIVVDYARPQDAPLHAIVDAVTDRRLRGPTELTAEELATLVLEPPTPKKLLAIQRRLQEVGITWPGSPKLPDPPPERPKPVWPSPTMIQRAQTSNPYYFYFFDRDPLVRVALRAYVEAVLSQLDPLERHPFTACVVPRWKGDLKRGAFFNGNGCGSYDVVAWTEAGVVGLAYELGFGPLEQFGLSVDAVKGGPDDVRAALPELPAELFPAFELAVGLLEVGAHGEKRASLGFWLLGAERVEGTFFDVDATAPGARRLAAWGRTGNGTRLLPVYDPNNAPRMNQAIFDKAEPIHDLVDAVTDRALKGPTELLPDELATLLPTPPDPERLLDAQCKLQKVGITWPGSPEIPSAG
ncbi:hypothetical protein [Polyangium sp. 6x1]|uniref:hypothetical protein n=1 Tax=Polyangium sp. 6x1 TaxID=3042689 RepID=UPI002482B5D4|nr:hypothetical protein [Polyangium sp. 6x1]MDI1446960.1 hypothetical protein [Polyangium sp. 6x1]